MLVPDGESEQSTGRSQALFAPQEVISLRERVYDTVRDAIIAGRLKPGERLKERVIAQQMRISTTPVKEALRQLQQDGLVDAWPHRGAVVSNIALTSVEESVEIRAGLESLAARLACRKMPATEVAQLDRLLVRMEALTRAGQVPELVQANAAFHEAVRLGARNHFITTFVQALQPFDRGVRQRALNYPDEAQRGYSEHAEIAAAIRRRAGAKAERLMRNHILRTIRFVIDQAAQSDSANQCPMPAQDGQAG